ncbi:MAG: DUF6526 family protein [Lutimonas sp.]
MKKQTFSSHRRFDPLFHFIAMPALLILLIGSIINLVKSSHDNLYSASLIVFISVLLVLATLFSRGNALRAQDRAIVAEEKLRYYLLAKKALPADLSVRQIIGLRFASDEEYLQLVERALKEKLSENQIKKEIKNWKGDYYRV